MIDDFNKRQRVIDLGEEAEDEILESTGKTESPFDTPQYRRVMAACKERDKFPTQAWIPDEEENKYCVKCGSKLGIDCGEAEPDYNEKYCSKGCFETSLIDFTKDSEYIRLYGSKD